MIDLAKVSLRAASDRDRDFGFAVKKAALRAYIEPNWGWDEAFQVEFHRKDWAQQRPQIITLGGEDIGTIEIVKGGAGFHLGEFYLFPAYQRQGIGQHLMAALLRDADAAGAPIRLEVFKNNPVQSLYLRCGFRITGKFKTHYRLERAPT
jgi:ribosomal protein S18 acetylase RimI-like enzyme